MNSTPAAIPVRCVPFYRDPTEKCDYNKIIQTLIFTHLKNKKMKSIKLSVIILLFTAKIYGQACPQDTCTAKAAQIGTICHSNGGKGSLVYIPVGTGWCYCLCSCLASNTPVAQEGNKWKPIGDIKIGEKVLALQKDGKWLSSDVIYSDGTENMEKPIHYAIYTTLENGNTLISTADHIYLLANGKLKRADRLSPLDKLSDENKKPLTIIQVVAGEYKGSVHNIAVGKWDNTTSNLDGHFILTKGVISGDYYVQSIAKESTDIGINLPQVGSTEYSAKFKTELKSERMLGLSQLSDTIKLTETNYFKPYKNTKIPSNAINFLPKEYEEAAVGLLYPLDNSVPYEVAEYIVYNFKRFYPNVVYHIDWTDNTVNAYAWMEGNTRHVALKGGLIRHRYIQQEGVGLVLAHDLGHHYGGGPRYPNNPWASCEGQADYWGSLVAERNVWWGQYALEQIEKGSLQVYNLFAYGLRVGNLFEIQTVSLAGICTHPAATCRLATYRAGLKVELKPACAGDAPSK